MMMNFQIIDNEKNERKKILEKKHNKQQQHDNKQLIELNSAWLE